MLDRYFAGIRQAVLSAAEITRGVQGALGFLWRDPAAPQHFDNTMEACLRSFQGDGPGGAALRDLSPAVLFERHEQRRRDGDRPRRGAALRRRLAAVPGDLLRDRPPPRLARSLSALYRALNWINLPAMVLAIVGVAISTVAPTAVAIILDLGLQALLFYWFLTATRMTLGARAG